MIIAPLRPTWTRYKKLAFSRLSLLRSLEYERIPDMQLSGRVFDLGGGKTAHYARLLKGYDELHNLNISPAYEPTYVADANKRFPVEDATYDTLVSFNTLEHIENDINALSESLRILKPGGTFHLVVPFLYRVHASPHDYHRHTAMAWEKILEEHGVPAANQVIEPLMWDSLSTGFSFVEMTRLRYLKPLVMLIGLLRVWGFGEKRLPEHLSRHWSEYALGYYISGTKPA